MTVIFHVAEVSKSTDTSATSSAAPDGLLSTSGTETSTREHVGRA